MRTSLGVALAVVIVSGHALGAKPKPQKPVKPPVTSLNSSDPADKELSEKKLAAPPETPEQQHEREELADAAEVERLRARSQVGAFGNVLIGFGKAPEAGTGTTGATGRTTSVTLIAGGRYDVSPELTFAARVPWTVGSARQPDGRNSSVQALGAPELLGEYRVTLSPFTRLPILFGLGLPIAQGNYDSGGARRQTQLNEVADAVSGYRDPELFGPKRLPLILGVGVDYQRRELNLHAATKLVAGVKLGGTLQTTSDAAGSYELAPVTVRSVTSAGVSYQLHARPNWFAALDSWLVYNAVNAVEFTPNAGASSPTRLQVVFEPRVGAHFGKISPSVGYIFPIGGRLADNSASGLELHCDVAL